MFENFRRVWLRPLLVLVPCTFLVLFCSFLADWVHRPAALHELNPLQLLFNYDLETLQNALGNLASTVAAVMGVVITVVAIVVQLAATRYTPRVTELFFREPTNIAVLGFFVVSCVTAIWVSLAVGNGFLPRTSVVVCVVATTTSLLLIVPYFAYVFDFLEPERVVSRIEEQASAAARAPSGSVEDGQLRVLAAIEQLADIAVAAISQKDKIISARAVDALRALVIHYTVAKGEKPAAWFEPTARLCQNPEFISMNQGALSDLVRDRVWLEWLVLRKYQNIFNEALADNPDMNYLIAIDSRYVGEAILAKGQTGPAMALVVKFFNTYLRATLNRRQVRTAYNLMNQYRQLVEAVIAGGHDDLAAEVAGYLRYYGQTAHGMDLGFVTETIAYDVATLCELAHRMKSSAHDKLLASLLELDKEAESEAQESTLRGVRKAQARLATYYMQQKDEVAARRIHADMEHERPERLASIRDELLGVKTKDFWEVIDRGANFDYMEDERKELLRRFFEWFPSVGTIQRKTGRVKPPTGALRVPNLAGVAPSFGPARPAAQAAAPGSPASPGDGSPVDSGTNAALQGTTPPAGA